MLRTLFSVKGRVARRQYLTTGLSLMVFKYLIDAVAVNLVAHVLWTPRDYLFPLLGVHTTKVGSFPNWFQFALLLWTLPFVWIGVTMMVRRARDAGKSPAWCAAFFVPFVNYAVMLWLGALPSVPQASPPTFAEPASDTERFSTALFGVLGAAAFGLLAILTSVVFLRQYGGTLFLGTPFVQGMVCGWAFNRERVRSVGQTIGVVWISLFLVAGTVFLFAMEGVLCLLMALPLAAGLGIMGGVIGRQIALRGRANLTGAAAILFVIPTGALVEKVTASAPPTYEVVTTVDVAAPATIVWEKVVQFKEIEAPLPWYFRTGIAYPVRATIAGRGVGAIRRCEFSTGAFVEPITVWDEPRRLAFSVREQPAPLTELSIYSRVYAPHVNGYFRSERGEFRLIPLKNGGTRLEGHTWYSVAIHPQGYWRAISEVLLHDIHRRVLDEVKREAEVHDG
ncbi:MAG: hypothetical protein QOK07_1888 [Gemmatimonadaceae bacterium]|nr:hypothetical protein [Gemmatimonadaceae bacterium]